jgi:hypothetical protein
MRDRIPKLLVAPVPPPPPFLHSNDGVKPEILCIHCHHFWTNSGAVEVVYSEVLQAQKLFCYLAVCSVPLPGLFIVPDI